MSSQSACSRKRKRDKTDSVAPSPAKRLKTTPSKPKAFSMAGKGVVRIDDASANYFRLRRAGLLPGTQYESIEEAVTAACGLQAQEFSSAMLALSLRVRDSTLLSTQTKAEELFFGLHPRLVRIYAQRTTIHVYTTTDWPLVASCCITAEWKDSETKCDAEIADKCEKCLRESGINGATKNEITEKAIATSSKDLGVKVNATDWEQNPFRQCAAHALQYMCSVGRGVLGQSRSGKEQTYIHKSCLGFSDIALPVPASGEEMARRYLHSYAPATEKDLRRYFGASASTCKGWLTALRARGELIDIECGDRAGLVALAKDSEELKSPLPKERCVLLLPRYDSLTLAHADKSWLFTSEAIGAISGEHIQPYAIVGGKIVAKWRHIKNGVHLHCFVEPLPGASKADIELVHATLVSRAPALTTFFGATKHSVDAL